LRAPFCDGCAFGRGFERHWPTIIASKDAK
jgi:hypothetical protein